MASTHDDGASPSTSGDVSLSTGRAMVRPMLVASLTTVTATLPLFQIGALAVQITDELAFGAAALGTAAGMAQAMRALVGAPVGRLVDRLGATTSLRIGVGISATASLGIATTAFNWWSLVAWMLLASVGHTFTQPAANRFMINRVRASRLGIAFGVKQSGPPTSTMIAGLSVPILAVTVGWRWAYILAAAIAVAVLLFIPRSTTTKADRKSQRKKRSAPLPPLRDRSTLFVIAIGFGLGFLASAVIITFYVDSAVRAGVSEEIAGTMFAVASVASIMVRLSIGVACDRTKFHPFRMCAILLMIGTLGHAMFATAIPWVMSVGVIVALAGTWGFPSAFWLGLMRAYPEGPGRVTGLMAPAVLVGGGLGPMAFGLIAETISYRAAWTAGACISFAASLGLVWSARRLDRRDTSDRATASQNAQTIEADVEPQSSNDHTP
ncbi:MAG: MFS transporter [Nitriliruptoraceae bacterium]